MIIAIDGTAGVGKGTLARGLARTLNLAVLDTGLLYRAVAYEMQNQNLDLENADIAARVARELNLKTLDHPALRTPDISLIASKISAYPALREELIAFQRYFAYHPPYECEGSILDGRDIGTVICPDATFKFFLMADIQMRAQRRYLELQGQGQNILFDELLAQMHLRDKQDSSRKIAPLKPAHDAHILNTTVLSREEVLQKALAIIRGD